MPRTDSVAGRSRKIASAKLQELSLGLSQVVCVCSWIIVVNDSEEQLCEQRHSFVMNAYYSLFQNKVIVCVHLTAVTSD